MSDDEKSLKMSLKMSEQCELATGARKATPDLLRLGRKDSTDPADRSISKSAELVEWYSLTTRYHA